MYSLLNDICCCLVTFSYKRSGGLWCTSQTSDVEIQAKVVIAALCAASLDKKISLTLSFSIQVQCKWVLVMILCDPVFNLIF